MTGETGILQTGGVLVTEMLGEVLVTGILVKGAVLAIQLLTGMPVTGALESTVMLTVGTQQMLEMEVCPSNQGRPRQPSHKREKEDPPLRLLKILL